MKNKKMLILFIVLVAIVTTICLVIKNNINKEPSVYYRTYTKEDGWSKWVKDGETSGNKKDDILNIQIKLKKDNTAVIYNLFTDDWSNDSYNNNSKIDNKKIKGIKISLMDNYFKKYNIYYRTYNSKNKWLEWTSNHQVSGNKNENISGIEIKILKKYKVPNDYLKDYNKSDYDSNVDY